MSPIFRVKGVMSMEEKEPFGFVLVESVGHALQAEKLLKQAAIPCKPVPVPRHLSSDCGICLRFNGSMKGRVEEILAGKLDRFMIVLDDASTVAG